MLNWQESLAVSEQLVNREHTVATRNGTTRITRNLTSEPGGRPIHSEELLTPRESFSRKCKSIQIVHLSKFTLLLIFFIFGWFKRSLNQSIGSFSANPHFALFRPDRRSDILGNISNHWGMVTYTFFWNNFFGSLIRARTGSFANVCAGTSPLYIKVGQISGLSKNGSWVLVDAHRFFFCRSWIRACTGRFKKLMI